MENITLTRIVSAPDLPFDYKNAIFYDNPFYYFADSLQDVVANKKKLEVPEYKRIYEKDKEKNPDRYWRMHYVQILLPRAISGTQKVNPQQPAFREIELRDSSPSKINAKFFDLNAYRRSQKHYEKLQAGLFRLIDHDPKFRRIHERSLSHEKLKHPINTEEAKYYQDQIEIINKEALERHKNFMNEFSPCIPFDQSFPLTRLRETMDFLSHEGNNPEVYFMRGIILAYCPKFDKFALSGMFDNGASALDKDKLIKKLLYP